MHAQRRAREAEQGSPGSSSVPNSGFVSPPIHVIDDLHIPAIRWGWMIQRLWVRLHRRRLGLALGCALIVLMVGVVLYLSPENHLRIYGSRLENIIPTQESPMFFVGITNEYKIWSEKHGSIDTPMISGQTQETGSIVLESSEQGKARKVTVRSHEWMIDETGHAGVRLVPPTHPSLTPGIAELNAANVMTKRPTAASTRVGRTLPLVLPDWPDGLSRRGRTWSEPVEWLEQIGEWKIFWKGTLRWTLNDFSKCDDDPCAELSYVANVTPHLWEAPSWAQKGLGTSRFTGQGSGRVRFDNRKHMILSNSLEYDGTLTLPIDNIARIPRNERIGRTPNAQPGLIVLQFHSKLDIRKP